MTITKEELVRHRLDGLYSAAADRGYPNATVLFSIDGLGWGLVRVASDTDAEPFVTFQPDHGQAYRDGLAYINSLPQMEVA